MIALSGQVLVRRAEIEDSAAIIAGIEAICTEGGAFHVARFVPTTQWETVLIRPESAPNHLLAVAEWQGCFAGAGRLFPGGSHTLHSHVAELGMFVLKPYRNRGIGRQLLKWMLDWAINSRLEKITLSVSVTNLLAICLYERFGFITEGRLVRQLKTDQTYTDQLLLALFLERPS